VLAVLTGQDAEADGVRPIAHRPVPTNLYEVPLRSREHRKHNLAAALIRPRRRPRLISGAPLAPRETYRWRGGSLPGRIAAKPYGF